MTEFSTIHCEVQGGLAKIALHRPELRNAFNDAMIEEIRAAFDAVGRDEKVRVVLLEGSGEVFCAGADLNWMKGMVNYSFEENVHDAGRLAQMFEAIEQCPKPVLAKVRGAAMGGGAGLVAAVDMAFAEGHTVFAFTEVKLGLIPAVISPFVVAKIGEAHARRYFLTGEKFDAAEAKSMGLVCEFGSASEIEEMLQEKIRLFQNVGPEAVAAAKALIRGLRGLEGDALRDFTAHCIAERRSSAEGQEGMKAFLEKRPATWCQK